MYRDYESPIPPHPYVDFDREPGRVHFIAPLIFNGVSVNIRGYINLNKLDGSAKMEFDPERAAIEDAREPLPAEPPETAPTESKNGDGKKEADATANGSV